MCALKQPLQFSPGTQKMNPSSPIARHQRYVWVWQYIHVKLHNKIVFHVNKHVFAVIWDSILNALMAAEYLKPWKNLAPNWKWCKLQCKEFTLEDWNSGWKVVFKTHTCQHLWKKGFYLAHLSGLPVLVWIKRAQSKHKKGVMLKM